MNEWEWRLLEDKTPVEHLLIAGVEVKAGDRVRLLPRKGGDVLDIALAGQTATIEAIEQDYEGKHHVCVVLDQDPGRDLGLMRQPGHRFFFNAEEVEPLPHHDPRANSATGEPRVLVAGIGNIFLGDDAFGVEVVRRLSSRELPEGVRAVDFGIRGFDLAYALQDGYETTIFVDACPRGEPPGTLYVLHVDPDALDVSAEQPAAVETHGMNPLNVLRLAKSMNAQMKNVLVVGCEPASLGGEEGHMGLSEPVEMAVNEAANLVESLVHKVLNRDVANASFET
jgi:hydrogenase maturation protease